MFGIIFNLLKCCPNRSRVKAKQQPTAKQAPSQPVVPEAPSPTKQASSEPVVSETPSPTKQASSEPVVSEAPSPTKQAPSEPVVSEASSPTKQASSEPVVSEVPSSTNTEGLYFVPVLKLLTPNDILRADGLRVASEQDIPEFLLTKKYGIWLSTASYETAVGNDEAKESDADGVKRSDYIHYVCSIKDIYCADSDIHSRVNAIEAFRNEHLELIYVEEKLLAHYRSYSSIVDILMFEYHFVFEDLVILHSNNSHYLKAILEINTRVEKSLRAAGYSSPSAIRTLSKKDLLKLDGVGPKTAKHLYEKAQQINTILQS